VSKLCHTPPETHGKHQHLRGHAHAHHCCVKSLIGSALVGFRTRQHARRESISKRAPSTTRTSLRAFRISSLRARPKTQIVIGIVIHPLRVCDHLRAFPRHGHANPTSIPPRPSAFDARPFMRIFQPTFRQHGASRTASHRFHRESANCCKFATEWRGHPVENADLFGRPSSRPFRDWSVSAVPRANAPFEPPPLIALRRQRLLRCRGISNKPVCQRTRRNRARRDHACRSR
jgi:hypothetical protein